MGRLILHIGTHKTATTTLQRHLYRNRKTLAARGIWYPDYRLTGEGHNIAHQGMANGLAGRSDRYSPQDARRFFRDVRSRVRDHDATIISGEPFYRHVAQDGIKQPYTRETYWPLRHAFIAQVREVFGDIPAEIAVVFRRQVDYAPSLYQEQVKITRYSKDFATFRQEFWYHFDYLGQARAWAHAFDALRPMRFEDVIAEGDPAKTFGRMLGLDLTGPGKVVPQNVSMHPDAVVLKRTLHAINIKKDVLRADIEAILDGPLRTEIPKIGNRSLYANAEDMAAFHQNFRPDNLLLGREFFSRSAQDGDLFSNDLRTDLHFGDRLDPLFLNMLVQGLKPRGWSLLQLKVRRSWRRIRVR
jgi:hypothetical protein